jgi:hypothetical protein
MNKKLSAFIFASTFVLTVGFMNPASCASTSMVPVAQQTQQQVIVKANPIDVVNRPYFYLNKKIKMNVVFDKFSTLGLDYSKVKRSSENYIGFSVQRNDISDHNVPLSEMKLFLKRDYAEQFAELDCGDKLEITGTIFSTALGDPWVDVEQIVVKEKVKKEAQ